MKIKESVAASAVKEEPERVEKKEAREEQKEEDPAHHGVAAGCLVLPRESQEATPQAVPRAVAEVIDILERDILRERELLGQEVGQEVERYLNDPAFLALVNDSEFQRKLERVCRQTVRRYKAEALYEWRDLKQDVLIKFGLALPLYDGEVAVEALLRRIARNQFIDQLRRPQERKRCSLEELVERTHFEVAERGQVDAIEHRDLIEKCLGALSERERTLFLEHQVEGRSLTDIADEGGVTRQAVSRRWKRIVRKLKVFLC